MACGEALLSDNYWIITAWPCAFQPLNAGVNSIPLRHWASLRLYISGCCASSRHLSRSEILELIAEIWYEENPEWRRSSDWFLEQQECSVWTWSRVVVLSLQA